MLREKYFNREITYILILISSFPLIFTSSQKSVENERGVKEPNKCEVCKYMAAELQKRIDLTGKSKETLKIGSSLMDESAYRVKKYETSELRYIEITEKLCEHILEYNVHKERLGSRRYAKGRSETMSTLHGLKDRGVKVELGIPEQLWDSPSAEITDMKRKCDYFMETYEDVIEDWYYHHNSLPILDYLCKEHILVNDEQECLSEVWTGQEKVNYDDEASQRKSLNDGEEEKVNITDKAQPKTEL
ncbi:unnamed protein product [Gordionus sp. m RMFG-2023]|uniref:protein canopy 4-like n=1 Tax=Gordionus sp. m RMFG-2023 TaxID=3053472 RepID=UPI0030DF28DE